MQTDLSQDFLFQRIREILPPQLSLVDVVSEILHVSSDSAYRRIRGETPLVLEEARQICLHFNLSLDQVLNIRSGYTLFQTTRIDNNAYSFENYLQDILNHLENIDSFMHKQIIYLTKDIPIFYNFSSEALFAFRYFFWMKSFLQHATYKDAKFSIDCLTPEIKNLGSKIINRYMHIPSTEILNTECVDSLIFQIEYYKDAGYFASKSDVRLVYEGLEHQVEHIRDQAEAGCKFLNGENPQYKKDNYKCVFNRVLLGDTTILIITDHLKTLFLNYDALNYMITRDEKFCNDVHNDLINLIKQSTQISSVSEKQRNSFFNILISKIEARKKYV